MSEFQIPKATDRVIIEFLQFLIDNFDGTDAAIYVGNRHIQFGDENDQSIISRLKSTKIYSIGRAKIKIGGQLINYYARQIKNPNNNQYISNHYLDTLDVFDGFSDDFDYIGLHEYIEKKFKISSLKIGQFGEQEKDLLLSHHNVIGQLEQSLAQVGEHFTKARLELEDEFSSRKEALEAETKNTEKELKERFLDKEELLAKEKEALKQKIAALDDRDNTHVRREIRNQFKKTLSSYKEKFELTPETRNLRLPIHMVVLSTMAVIIVGISYFSTSKISTSSALLEFFWIAKPIGLTIAAFALLTWYLNWNSKWSERHAKAEFELRKLEMDMDRASWVVESSLEWKDNEGSNIPDHLLESLSRNLFTNNEGGEFQESQNAADQLASALLGQASKASLNIGGNTVEFDRKSLKQAGK